jgi:hypothetical protein
MERGCVGDQPQNFRRAAAEAVRTAALRRIKSSGYSAVAVRHISAYKFIDENEAAGFQP